MVTKEVACTKCNVIFAETLHKSLHLRHNNCFKCKKNYCKDCIEQIHKCDRFNFGYYCHGCITLVKCSYCDNKDCKCSIKECIYYKCKNIICKDCGIALLNNQVCCSATCYKNQIIDYNNSNKDFVIGNLACIIERLEAEVHELKEILGYVPPSDKIPAGPGFLEAQQSFSGNVVEQEKLKD